MQSKIKDLIVTYKYFKHCTPQMAHNNIKLQFNKHLEMTE